MATIRAESTPNWPPTPAIERNRGQTLGTGVEPDFYEPVEPCPLPRDPDTFELFGDEEPSEAPESIPSPDEGDEAAALESDPARVVLGQASA